MRKRRLAKGRRGWQLHEIETNRGDRGDDGFKDAMERGVYAASTWKNERF